MTLKPDQLLNNGYYLLDQLDHKELVPFIQTYIKKRTKYSLFYFLTNFILLALVVYYFVQGHNLPIYSFADRMKLVFYGFAMAIALTPLHEYIHVLSYKYLGAKNTSYDVNLKKFYFLALADKFISNKKEFEIIALAPFVFISTTLIVLTFMVNADWVLIIYSVLFVHTSMCSGDFGLLSYFEYHKDKQVITYDDVEQKVSYFYGRTDGNKTVV